MSGTLSAGVCFASQAAAARNECSLTVRNSTSVGFTCQAVLGSPSETDGGSYLMSYSQRFQTSQTAFTTQTVTTQLLECSPQDYWPFAMSAADGVLISVAVASVWCSAWALRAVRSVLSDRDEV